MNFTEIIRQIKATAYALDQLEVKGHDNLDILLGSIQNLNRIAAQVEKEAEEMEAKAKIEIVPTAE